MSEEKKVVRPVSWPHDAKCAFSLSFDLDGDTIWRNKTVKLPNGSQYIKGRSIGLFGPERGAARILDILRNYDLKATWFVPTDMMQEHPDVIEMIRKEGHEFAHHGLDHTGRYGETFDQQCARIGLSQELFKKYTGDIARGMRPTGMLLPQTERWLCLFQRRNKRRGRRLVLCERHGNVRRECSVPG